MNEVHANVSIFGASVSCERTLPSDGMVVSNSGLTYFLLSVHHARAVVRKLSAMEQVVDDFRGATGFLPEDASDDDVVLFLNGLALSGNTRVVTSDS